MFSFVLRVVSGDVPIDDTKHVVCICLYRSAWGCCKSFGDEAASWSFKFCLSKIRSKGTSTSFCNMHEGNYLSIRSYTSKTPHVIPRNYRRFSYFPRRFRPIFGHCKHIRHKSNLTSFGSFTHDITTVL